MKTRKTVVNKLLMVGFIVAAAAQGVAQTTTTIVADYGKSPSSGSDFSIKLQAKGDKQDVAGFAFKLHYDPTQVAVTGVNNNTGQSGAGVQYTLGPVTEEEAGKASRVLSATTLSNLKNAEDLVEIKLLKQPGFAAPLYFNVTDRSTQPIIDGLQGATLENIPHTFDASAVNR